MAAHVPFKPDVLRIHEGAVESDSATIRLEGKIIGPWVAELRGCCESILRQGRRLTLDLGQVSFVDKQGVRALKHLIGRDTSLINCPLFVSEQLRNGEPEGR